MRPQEVVVVSDGNPPYRAQAQVPPVYMQQGHVVRSPYALPPQRYFNNSSGLVYVQQAPVDQRPLGVAFVRMPAEVIEQRGKVQFFGVDVTPEQGGAPWRVMRRYNDFHSLLQRLGRAAMTFPGAPFPHKQFFTCTGHRLEERRSSLELWLRRAIESPHSAGPWLRSLRDFLEGGRQSLPVLPQAAVLGQVVPQAPALSQALQVLSVAPPPLPPAATLTLPEQADAHGPEEEDDDEADYFEIQVPPGVAAGQLLGVTLPDGRQLALPLPDGVAAGAALELRYEAATGKLTPVK